MNGHTHTKTARKREKSQIKLKDNCFRNKIHHKYITESNFQLNFLLIGVDLSFLCRYCGRFFPLLLLPTLFACDRNRSERKKSNRLSDLKNLLTNR